MCVLLYLWIIVYERRESQASTNSSTSLISMSEDDDPDVQRLNQALESNSETDEESHFSPVFSSSRLAATTSATNNMY